MMAKQAIPNCLFCATGLPLTSSRRKLLGSTSNSSCCVIQFLDDMSTASQSLKSVIDDRSVLCKKCFSGIENLMKRRVKLRKEELQLRDRVDAVIASISQAEPMISTPRKRTASDALLSTPTRNVKCRYDTPVRRTLQKMYTSSSPAVAVSYPSNDTT